MVQLSDATNRMSVYGTFARADQMQDAIDKLSMSGFDRADLSLPTRGLVDGSDTPESSMKPAATEADSRQARTLGASTAATVAAMAAAGVTIATGGAAIPAVAAALAAGGAAGGSAFAIGKVATGVEQTNRDDKAARGDLVLAVRALSEAKRSQAEGILREAGATDITLV